MVKEEDCGTDSGVVVKAFINDKTGAVIESLYDRIVGRYTNKKVINPETKEVICDKLTFVTEQLLKYLNQEVEISDLKRTFALIDGKVQYINNPLVKDYKFSEVGTPDYTDLHLDQYISVIEVVNPMHRLWSDGRWNKLTMAHGCYWGKCTFRNRTCRKIQSRLTKS